MLQLAYMKHFTNPLSIFAHDELLGIPTRDDGLALISSPAFAPAVEAIHARLFAASGSQPQNDGDGRPQTAEALLNAVSAARTEFRRQTRRLRAAFTVARIAERVALSDAMHGLVNGKNVDGRAPRLDSLEALSAIVRQRGGSQVRYVCMAVRYVPRPVTLVFALLTRGAENSRQLSCARCCRNCTRSGMGWRAPWSEEKRRTRAYGSSRC